MPDNEINLIDSEAELIERVSSAHGIFSVTNTERMDKYSPYGFFDINEISTMYKEYLFFTKPDLSTNGFKGYSPAYSKLMIEKYPDVIKYLTTGGKGFIPLLTNSVYLGNGSDVADITSMEMETMANVYGANVTYKGHSLESQYNTEFTIEFKDTVHLDTYMIFHFWDTYSTMKMLGWTLPKEKYMPPKCISEDQIAVYKIIVSDDYETIVYYGKWTGVYPKAVPRSAFTLLEPGTIKFSIPFKAFMYEDMNPRILDEFNYNAGYGGGESGTDYIGEGTGMDRGWKDSPYIDNGKLHGRPVYKLKWR